MENVIVKALCTTLMASVWQGLILAVITGLIVLLTRRSSPAKRYNLLLAAMLLFALVTGITFVNALTSGGRGASAVFTSPALTVFTGATAIAPNYAKVGFFENLSDYLFRNSGTIVLIWFLVVCARCLQLAMGLQNIYTLRRRYVDEVDRQWSDRVALLSRKLGIHRSVRLAESGIAKVPLVVGYLKPLILIPAGLLASLPAEAVEAILVHELAHIRRADYAVNLLQSLLEIIFFFNPAIWWLSSLIRAERENCCDDIAVAQSSSTVAYIKALVACQEYREGSAPAFAMALKDNKKHLKNRVTRLISSQNHSLNHLEKSLLAITLITTGLFVAAFTNAKKIENLVVTTQHKVAQIISLPGARLQPKSAVDYADTVNKLKKAANKKAIPARPDSAGAAAGDTMRHIPYPAHPSAYQSIPPHDPSAPGYKAYATVNDDTRKAAIINDMLKDGIISTTDNLSFKISTNEFIVNSKKQPDDVYQTYRRKYVKVVGNGEWSWMYNFDTGKKQETNSVVDNPKN
ncbi:M56 family metallopeptidase [Mucilaginibacter sp. UR6-11]|uniref:M56 family metallopeptidase n=1 Tax=Mucilaginibacter sp. UR6-11 TaxID=1435644 RepID=UPI001E3BC26D|nr:M56 family metallopeptidase [Mucilaginibacter sp. UR6-11]MCC8425945.1 M56 family metallopeptidase [Mucilaginibacter sp. UR6-11]